MSCLDNTYINTKLMLQGEGFNVKHLYSDIRNDWGDDGGYMFVISEKNETLYLQILNINYNLDVCSHVLDEKMLEENGGYPDFITFKNMDALKEFISEFIRVLDLFVNSKDNPDGDDEFYGEDSESFYEVLESKWDDLDFERHLALHDTESNIKRISEYLYTCFFSYSEYQNIDRRNILNMTNIPYVYVEETDENEVEKVSGFHMAKRVLTDEEKRKRVTVERFIEYMDNTKQDFIENHSKDFNKVFVGGYLVGLNHKWALDIIDVVNSKVNSLKPYLDVYEKYGTSREIFYRDLSDLINLTVLLKERVNQTLIQVSELYNK